MYDFFDKYFLYIMVTIFALISYIWLFINKKRLNIPWWEIVITGIFELIVGFTGAKALAMVDFGFEKGSFINGMRLYGAIFAEPIYFFIYAKIRKIPLSTMFDYYLIPLIFIIMSVRINCIHVGCCNSIVINGFEILIREIELVTNALSICIFGYFIIKKKLQGKLYPIYMISYGIIRFGLEFFRAEYTTIGFMHYGHFWSITSITIGIIVLVIQYIVFKRKESNYVDSLIMGSDDE